MLFIVHSSGILCYPLLYYFLFYPITIFYPIDSYTLFFTFILSTSQPILYPPLLPSVHSLLSSILSSVIISFPLLLIHFTLLCYLSSPRASTPLHYCHHFTPSPILSFPQSSAIISIQSIHLLVFSFLYFFTGLSTSNLQFSAF